MYDWAVKEIKITESIYTRLHQIKRKNCFPRLQQSICINQLPRYVPV